MKVGDKVIIARHGPRKGQCFVVDRNLMGIMTGVRKDGAVSASQLPSGGYIEVHVGESSQIHRGRPCPK